MWYQLEIKDCQHDKLDELSQNLEDQGALSIMLSDRNDDPVLEPAPGTTPLWPEVVINALFDDPNEAKRVQDALTQTYPELSYSFSELPDQDWERAWMDDFKPQRFGQRLWICPSWHTPPESDAVNLILDPGLAFGTGTHPTTALCLTWLDQADLAGKTMIDFGCGSGILALAAIKLGAMKVYAVDIDQQALQATENNAKTNDISQEQLIISNPEQLNQCCDVLMANILLSPLLALKQNFHQLLKPKGQLIVSGLLYEQVDGLIQAYQGLFKHERTEKNEDWALVAFSRA